MSEAFLLVVWLCHFAPAGTTYEEARDGACTAEPQEVALLHDEKECLAAAKFIEDINERGAIQTWCDPITIGGEEEH